jgi:hypothetical protein
MTTTANLGRNAENAGAENRWRPAARRRLNSKRISRVLCIPWLNVAAAELARTLKTSRTNRLALRKVFPRAESGIRSERRLAVGVVRLFARGSLKGLRFPILAGSSPGIGKRHWQEAPV